MKKIFLALALALAASVEAVADPGPTSIGPIKMGMSKAEYLTAVNVKGGECKLDEKTQQDRSKLLGPDQKSLCFMSGYMPSGKVASVETVNVNGVSYDVIYAIYLGGFFETIGARRVEAVFYSDRLVSLTMYDPEVDIKTLASKYGKPTMIDRRKVEHCKNNLGAEFNNEVGNLDFVWNNEAIRATYRINVTSPIRTCTDGVSSIYYILEEPSKVAIIDRAIATNKVVGGPF